MTLQESLFAEPEPLTRVTQPRTGKHAHNPNATQLRAALAIAPKSGTARAKLLKAIADAGFKGLTGEEMSEKTSLSVPSMCGRRKELEEAKWIVRTDRTRIASTGSPQAVYCCTARGFAEARRVS